MKINTISLLDLKIPVQYLKGIGPERAKLLNTLGIKTILDLLQYYPRDYRDCSKIKKISHLFYQKENLAIETIYATIETTQVITPHGFYKQPIYKVIIKDDTGIASLIFFNQKKFFKYFDKIFINGKKIIVSGNFKIKFNELQSYSFDYELIDEDENTESIQTGKIIPIYKLSGYVKNMRLLRNFIKKGLDEYFGKLNDLIPLFIREKMNFLDINESLFQIHFPSSYETLQKAKNRLIFDEFFFFQIALFLKKQIYILPKKELFFKITNQFISHFYNNLPFQLTEAQKKVIKEIKLDMCSEHSMNRLLQGDVGSGKTIVAIFAMLICCESGYQATIMAPTEILAEQHYLTLHKNLEKLGIKIGLLSSGLKFSEKKDTIKKIEDGEINIVIGTHSLIQESVKFKNLGLVVIDEQHKFGVLQRDALRKKGQNLDVLIMTATPIPRTLSLTVYGDLDVSILNELPKGRKQIITKWITEKKRKEMYTFLKEEIKKGHQVYIVYPLIEESEKIDLKAAIIMQKHLQQDIFPDLKVGLLHGKMKVQEKEEIMSAFKNNEIQILVCTTVVEVGIDIPNVTVMVIEHAERFGLSSLHQLRGRIGRGSKESYCLLFTGVKLSLEAKERIKAMLQTSDGFKIAELDLKQRGPGEFMGTRQHGLPDLKLANLITDIKILEIARKTAFQIIEQDKSLLKPEYFLIKRKIIEEYKEKMKLTMVG
ncbi:MAG: ATP-dependent DNA helicase RecG [bacterium]